MTWTPQKRTLLGVLLSLPFAVAVLGMFACLPAPVGNPEKSKVDPALNGAWRTEDKDTQTLILVRPWDSHTYFIHYFSTSKDPASTNNNMMVLKAWLTSLGGKTFIVCEPMQTFDYIPRDNNANSQPFWIVGQVEPSADSLKFRMVNSDAPMIKGLTTREQLEAAITQNANRDELYSDAVIFKKLGKDDAARIEDTLKKFSFMK